MHAAYVLHTRPYSETSLLVDALTADHGRVSLVARGAKRGKARASSLLQPFLPLRISWCGRGELVTLTNVEATGAAHQLQGRDAICGLYVNELLVKILPKWDPCMVTFANYQRTLTGLLQSRVETLRKFEKELITSLGYALQLSHDSETGDLIKPDKYYMYDPKVGPRQVKSTHVGAIQGSSLLAFASDNYHADMLNDATRLMRVVLSYYLGNKKLVTRELLS